MERLVLSAMLLVSLILQFSRSDPAPAAQADAAPWMSPAAPPVPPAPPMPPVPPAPPGRWHGALHGLGDLDVDIDFDFDFDFDFDHRLRFLDRLSLEQVISRDLAAGEAATCPAGAVCSYTCDGGGCKIDCASGSVCSTTCDGGGCHAACGDGAVCSLACEGDACTSTCGDGAVCHATDARGEHHTRITRRRP